MTTAPADRLREAATKIRKHAADATPGPWHRPLNTRRKCSVRGPLPEGERGEWIDGIDPDTGQRENCTVATIPIWSNGTFARKRGGRDLEWIALMHPGVGEALATLLETEARVDTEDRAALAVEGRSPEAEHGACTTATCTTEAALAVADAILGEAVTR